MEASPITTGRYHRLFFRVEEDRDEDDPDQDGLSSVPDDVHPSLEVIDLHLAWQPVTTPFTSFYSSWRKVMRRRQWLVDRGSPRLRIIIVESRNFGQVVVAREAALQLGYRNDDVDRRRQLRYFWDKYLVHGGVSRYKDAILASIPADGREVTVDEGGRPTRVPSSFWDTREHASIRDEFEARMYDRVGFVHEQFLDMLMKAIEYR